MTTRVLIVKLAALGDAVMASTLVTSVRNRWPDARIGWVAGLGIAPYVHLIEGLDEVIEVDERTMIAGSRARKVLAVLSAWLRVGRRWDIAIVAHTDARYAALAILSGARTTIRFAGNLRPERGLWYGAQYARLIDGTTASDSVHNIASIKRRRLPAPLVSHSSKPLIIVAPGGARNLLRDDALRRWPIESWVAVVEALVARGFHVVAVGGPDDAMECARCALAGAQDVCGQTTIPELMALMQASDVVVTHDSGPMHIAVALMRPVVALYGPTSPADFLPHDANVTVLSRASELACAPCYDGLNFAPCALNLCLARVPTIAVVQAVLLHLSHAGAVHEQHTR